MITNELNSVNVHDAVLELLRTCGVDPYDTVELELSADPNEIHLRAEVLRRGGDSGTKILHDGANVLTETVQRGYRRARQNQWLPVADADSEDE